MNDTALVRIGERAGDVAQNAYSLDEGQRRPSTHSLSKRRPFLVGHHEVEDSFGLPGIVHRNDVGMPEPRGDCNLLKKTLAAQSRRNVVANDFHGYIAVVL